MQSASRHTGLGLSLNRSRSALLLLLATLAAFALAAPTSNAQSAGLTCTISASASGFDASFSGTISGSASTPSWTLHYGDGGYDTGTGASVSDLHTYSALGTYSVILSATGQSFTGAPLSGSCSTRVTIKATFSVDVQDGLTVQDQVTYIPPLRITDSVAVSDQAGNNTPLRINDSLSIPEQPSLTGPGAFGDSAKFTDKASVSLGSNNTASAVILLTVSTVSIVGVAIALWRIVLPRFLER